MLTVEFEKKANLIGKGLARIGKSLQKGYSGLSRKAGRSLETSGQKMVNKSQLVKADSIAKANLARKSVRTEHLSAIRKRQGKSPLTMPINSKAKAAREAQGAMKSGGKKSLKGADTSKKGIMGFIRKNPVASTIGAGTAGYMVGKPSSQPNYQYDRPMLG